MLKRSLLPLAPLLAGAALVALSGDPALARGYGEASSLPIVDAAVDWIGFRDLTGDRRDLFAYCLIAYALFFGPLTDLVLQERGFGKALNGVVGIVGICLALHFVGEQLPSFHDTTGPMRFNLMLIIAGAGSALTLVAASVLKNAVMGSLRRNLDRLYRAPPPKPLATEPPLDPRIASALREKR
ncbi:hypothetical protein QM467_19520 [Rhodoblastus sp. 17X3]|uniref:hypothetical protein n=1 Tax=Rhodoblastus sp. 17X3 TaxID=3047026 RepID=UPI0024B6B8C1|nr:hypothetical protein [Rhodoblastus sp. 17X3]MDI9850230.1 hypothetical protein [Rhodoblastus sp. 17X3]